MNYIKAICLTLILAVFSLSNVANAASLYLDPGISVLNRGDALLVSVRLDTDEEIGECVNAVDGVLTYSANIDPVDISTGESIFSVWVESPVINKENRTITFAGGIPNGYCGRISGDPRLSNVIAHIVFRSPGFTVGGSNDETQAKIDFAAESTAYLNDGRGTKANLTTFGSTIELSKAPGDSLSNPWQDRVEEDNVPPTQFPISLQKGDKEFSGKWYIVFNTSDKQTGIDYYEVIEEEISQFGTFKWGGTDAPWVRASSPYVLKDQTLNSIIRVKAVDKAGNESIATIIPDEANRGYSFNFILTIVVSLALVGLVVGLVIFALLKLKKRNKENKVPENEVTKVNSYDETN